jgi:hypothetical protein
MEGGPSAISRWTIGHPSIHPFFPFILPLSGICEQGSQTVVQCKFARHYQRLLPVASLLQGLPEPADRVEPAEPAEP